MVAAKLPDATEARATEIVAEIRALLAKRTARSRRGAVPEHYAQQAALIAVLRSWAYRHKTREAELAVVSLLADDLRHRCATRTATVRRR